MQWGTIAGIVGRLVTLFSLSSLPPLLVSLLSGDGQTAIHLVTLAVTLFAGLALWLPTRRLSSDLRTRDGFLIVALFWFVLGVFGGLPFMLGPHLDFTDAVFESVSGFTTTGATVLTGIDDLPPSLLYHRQQLQWLGGMGVVVLAVAIIPMLGVGGMQLYRAEMPGPMKEEKLAPRIMQTARMLWLIYVSLTGLCAVAYWFAGMTAFDAIAHAFTTVATGGYSTHDASIGHFDSVPVELVANVFMLLGGINFAVHFVAWRGRSPLAYWRNPEVRVFLILVAAFSLLIAATLVVTGTYLDPVDALRDATFTVISVITTTGYGTANFPSWPLYIPLLIAVISYIGGCAGSTSGGMKVFRIMLLFKQGQRETFLLIHPRSTRSVKVGNRPVDDAVMESVWGFYSLYVLASLVLTGLMMAVGLDFVSAFGAVIATINLLGPGLGEVATTFATVPDAAKWLGIAGMLLGRLEVFTLVVLLTPAFWRS
ncbi:TrkH family potassium uptake protein [Sediminicurvatus halobius]|uniref:Trk system potassium uptake protein n=1 Tax=Sediminicurvatus halobius TaxID=2182432 RepID=A0A2U2N623_9GAMM|nr:TrkH family potassium uptake protein [Spiribacter halobius]PWG64522.1 potassium transporter [Spiribacter halobius]UEX79157.1 TrkH family potassium uptake protein [Spiribacter halobius]